jgi:D-alanine-D-alanine ligase
VGTYIIKNKKTLERSIKKCFKVSDRVMVQEFIPGREFTCGVIEKKGQPLALTPTEIISESAFFDYSAKYKVGGSVEITPPNLSKNKIMELQMLALKAHTLLNCAGMSRSDFILSGSKFYILETNTIPGLTETSLLPQGAKASGINFKELMNLIIQSAHV